MEHTDMEDRQINELLKAIPREKASTGFTPRLLGRLEREQPRAGWPRWSWAAAMAAAMLALVLGGIEHRHRTDRQQSLAELARLRAAHGALSDEIETLHRLRETQPVLYLGGDEQVDVVLDLSSYGGEWLPGKAQPATYENVTY